MHNYKIFLPIILGLILTFVFIGGLSQIVYASAPAATITLEVDTQADTNATTYRQCTAATNDCSLRGAISKANADPGNDYIINLQPVTYTLSLAGSGEDDNATGDLDIMNSLIINGAGQTDTVIDSEVVDRIMHIMAGAVVEINHLTITGGQTPSMISGGGIYNAGSLTLNEAVITQNNSGAGIAGVAGGNGGGIFVSSSGILTINDSIIADNQAGAGGNGGTGIAGGAGGHGGGIFVSESGDLTIGDSTITDNQAGAGGNGGVGASEVNGGAGGAGGHGGGIYIASSGTLTITNGSVTNNQAGTGGTGGRGEDNFSGAGAGGAGGHGGGIYVSTSGTFTITNSSVTNNQAGGGGQGGYSIAEGYSGAVGGIGGYGGGIYLATSGTFTDGSITNNQAGAGGNGGRGGSYGNGGAGRAGGNGGGIYISTSGTFTITNSPLAGNQSGAGGNGGSGSYDAQGGRGGNGGEGGGIANQGILTVMNTTLNNNNTQSGGSGGTGGNSAGPPGGNGGDGGDGGNGGGIANRGILSVMNAILNNNNTQDGGSGGNGGSSDGSRGGNGGDGGDGGDGGGIAAQAGSTLTISQSTVEGNSTGSGGPGGTGGTGHTSNGSPGSAGEDGTGGGMYNQDDSPTLTNISFVGNTSDNGGGGLYNETGQQILLVNVTFANNAAENGGGIYHASGGGAAITNAILWGNTATLAGTQIYHAGTVNTSIKNSDIQDSGGSAGWDAALGTDGGGNLDADPIFKGEFTDLRLVSASPAVDSGDNTACPEVDLRGLDRTDGNCDMGAYEYLAGDQIVLRVDQDAPGPIHDGLAWTTAYTTVQDALAAFVTRGDQIWVAEGIYYPDEGAGQTDDAVTSTFALPNGVAIYGGFAGTETSANQRDWHTHITVLSGDLAQDDATDSNGVVTDTFQIAGANAYHVVTGSGAGSSAILDGFTITAGQAHGAAPDDDGGGLYNSGGSPTLTNLIFSGNYANRNGSGLFNITNSNPAVSATSFRGNYAAYRGGAIANMYASNATFTNVIIAENTSDGGGGAMFNRDSSPTLINATVVGNHTAIRGGGFYNWESSYPILTNVIIWGNTASLSNPQIYNRDGATPVITYSDIQGGYAGTGNLAADPLFVIEYDDLHLQEGSPVIDVGDNTFCPSTDLDGVPRPQHDVCDMGAYEKEYYYALTVSTTGTGNVTSNPSGIDCGLDCTESFVDGTVVTLTATADTGSDFTSWSGACSGTGDCTVTMTEPKSVTATFILDEVTYQTFLPMIRR